METEKSHRLSNSHTRSQGRWLKFILATGVFAISGTLLYKGITSPSSKQKKEAVKTVESIKKYGDCTYYCFRHKDQTSLRCGDVCDLPHGEGQLPRYTGKEYEEL